MNDVTSKVSEVCITVCVSVWVERCGPGVRRQIDALLVHAFGLRAQDEAEEVFIGDSGAARRGRWRSTSLVIKPGTLE